MAYSTEYSLQQIMYIYAMQPAHNYVCMCMWLCTFRLCSYLVTMYARACDYAHLCHAVCLHLCIHEHVIMHIYVMHPAIPRIPEESFDHLFGLFNRLSPQRKNIWLWVIHLVSLLDSVSKRISSFDHPIGLSPVMFSLEKLSCFGSVICHIKHISI